jgi:hypothetical protein
VLGYRTAMGFVTIEYAIALTMATRYVLDPRTGTPGQETQSPPRVPSANGRPLHPAETRARCNGVAIAYPW